MSLTKEELIEKLHDLEVSSRMKAARNAHIVELPDGSKHGHKDRIKASELEGRKEAFKEAGELTRKLESPENTKNGKIYFPKNVADYVAYINDNDFEDWYPFDIIGETYKRVNDKVQVNIDPEVEEWIQENEDTFVEGIVNGFKIWEGTDKYYLVSEDNDTTFVHFDNNLKSCWTSPEWFGATYKTANFEEITIIKILIEIRESKKIKIQKEEG